MCLLKSSDLLICDLEITILVITVFVILELFIILVVISATIVALFLTYVTLIREYHYADVRTTMLFNFLKPAVDVQERFTV